MEMSIEQALHKGVAAHNQGDLEEAERLYRAILQSQPFHPDANHNLGVLAVSVHRAVDALPLLRAALEANPDIEQFWLSYIDALLKAGKFQDASKALAEGRQAGVSTAKLQIFQTQVEHALFPSGDKPQQIKKIAGAAEVYEKALALNPVTASIPYKLGLVAMQAEEWESALLCFEKALKIDPTIAGAHNNLGLICESLGRLDEAKVSYEHAIALNADSADAYYNLGNTLQKLERLDQAEVSYNRAITLRAGFAEARVNLGNTQKKLGKLNEAEASYGQAIALKPDHAEAHCNLGITLQELGKFDEAETSYNQAIELNPSYAEAHSNLGITLQELGKFDEAEASYNQAIRLKPDDAEAHSNLGITLQELGKLEEAEASYKQAIALKLDLTEAHCNLGNTLQALGRLDEAEASYNQAIALKPDLALAHYGLGTVLCIKGDEDLALKSLINAHEIDPQSKAYELLLTVMKARKSLKGSEVAVGNTSNVSALPRLISSPLVLKRAVEPELIASLYDMHSIRLDKAKDARYGNGITSPDFNLFENAPPIIQKAAEDLTRIMMMALKSNIYIDDSFFNILKAGGGTKPHNHLNILDRNIALDLGRQKYSLVYYLSVGDQSCSDPGILRLHEPSEEIFPCAGMIIIIPASRKHSASYNGKLDRVMVGVNFYSV